MTKKLKQKVAAIFNNKNKQKLPQEGWQSFVKTLLLAGALAIAIRSFFYEPFHIPSGSMKPGLLVGDYIFVSKMSYGYSKYSFPFASFHLFEGRFFETKPKRGDAAVFRLPSDPKINYIKRIIGLPGDLIKVTDGKLFINDQEVPKIYVNDFTDDDATKIAAFEEKIDDKKYQVLDQYQDLPQDNTGYYEVPEGHYFVMGDNRDNSEDSRFQDQVGFIPEENFIGRATMIFFSSKDPIWEMWKLPASIRFSRIFKRIN